MTDKAQNPTTRLRASFGMVLLTSTLVGVSCSAVEENPADIPIETTTSAGSTPTTTSPKTETEPSDSAPDRSVVDLEWTEADLSGSTFVDHLLATQDGFVAYRFAHDPGAWTSQDGVRWTARELRFETESDELAVYSLTRGGPGYVAIGSDPATMTDDDHRALWISSDGLDWKRHDLVIEDPPLGRFAEVNVEFVVGGPDGRLILVGRMDPPEGAFDEHEFVVWTSEDGLAWSLQTESFPPGSYIDYPIHVTPQGFIVNGFVEGGESGEATWLSVEGQRWKELSLDFTGEESPKTAVIGGSTRRVVSWGDRLLTVAGTGDGIGLWVSDDGGSWTDLDSSETLSHTTDLLVSIDDVVAGPAGIVLTGRYEPRPPEPQPMSFEKDGRVLTVDFEAQTVTVTDDGEVLLELGLDDAESIFRTDDESLTVMDPESGEELISVTHEEWSRGLDDAGLVVPEFEETPPQPKLWLSPDGENWSVVDVEETFAVDHPPTEVVVGGESVVVTWSGLELDGYVGDEITGELEDPPAVIWVGKLIGGP